MAIKYYLKAFFIVHLLLFYNTAVSQKIKGQIVNDSLKGVESANIILKEAATDNTLTYTTTDSNGFFEISNPHTKDSLLLKISALGYKPIEKKLPPFNQDINLGTLKLGSGAFELNEVVLTARKQAIITHGDTTTYNVERFKNGTEKTLKDLIKNLPGLSINDNGRITADGKEITELLIEGENMYQQQHQLATENFSSDAVKSVELYRNHQKSDALNDQNKTGQTALNIKLKDEYKAKIKGYTQAETNFAERYRLKNFLYNISTKNKFSLVHNTSNLGNNPISINDYYMLANSNDDTFEKESSNVLYSSINDVPKFLRAGENVAANKNNFLNITNVFSPGKKTKVNFYAILNSSAIREKTLAVTEVANTDVLFKEDIDNKEKSDFASFNLKTVHKPNENTIIKLKNTFVIDYLRGHNYIDNFSQTLHKNIYQFNDLKKKNFDNSLAFLKKAGNSYLSLEGFFNYADIGFRNTINATAPFLNLAFTDNNYVFGQSANTYKYNTGLNGRYKLPVAKASLTLQTELSHNKFHFNNTSNTLDDYGNFIDLKDVTAKNSAIIEYPLFKKINIGTSLDHNIVYQNINSTQNKTINYLGYSGFLKISFRPNTTLQLSYGLSNNLTNKEYLLQNYFIKDYRTIYENANLQPFTIFPTKKISISFFNFDVKNNTALIVNLNHNYSDKAMNVNIVNEDNYIRNLYAVSPQDKFTSLMVFYEKTFKDIPFKVSANVDFNEQQKKFFSDNDPVNFNSKYFSNTINLKSAFKKSPVHFTIGYNYALNVFKNNGNKSRLNTFQPYLALNGAIIKNLNWKLTTSNNHYRDDNNSRTITDISPYLEYSIKKMDFYFNANNIFNLHSPSILSNSGTSGYNTATVIATLPGYINFGVKYNY